MVDPVNPRFRDFTGRTLDNQVSGFTSDENDGETQALTPEVEEPSDEAAKELKAAQKKSKKPKKK